MAREVIVDRLSFSYYPGRDIFTDVSFSLKRGERALFFGPSGGGKSTLARVLGGIAPFITGGRLSGKVLVAGLDVKSHADELYRFVGFVPQEPESHITMTTVEAEIIASYAAAMGTALKPIAPPATKAAGIIGVEKLMGRKTWELSGGEMQRISIASALAKAPRVLIMDEPLSQQSAGGRKALRSFLDTYDGTILVFEHRVKEIAGHFDRFFLVGSDGTVTEVDRNTALSHSSSNRSYPVSHTRKWDLVVEDVSFSYGGRQVLYGLNWHLNGGAAVVRGPNGCGKSTLAKLIAGILKPDGGTILRPRTALLLQDSRYYFLTHSVREDMELQCRRVGRPVDEGMALLDALGVGGLDRDPTELSVGERVRAVIALLMAMKPELLILDEPTRGLDSASRDRLCSAISDISAEVGVIIFTHDSDLAGILDAPEYIMKGSEIRRMGSEK